MKAINIIFNSINYSGHPEEQPDLVFVEIENDNKESVGVGTWHDLPNGHRVLRITDKDMESDKLKSED